MNASIRFVGLLCLFLLVFSAKAQRLATPTSLDYQRGTIVKGMLFPGIRLNNVSIGIEKLKTARVSLNANLGTSFGRILSSSFRRVSFRAGPRFYLLPFSLRENSPISFNLFTEAFVGASAHNQEFGSEYAYRSAHGGIAFGQQLFYNRLSFEIAAGLRRHLGYFRAVSTSEGRAVATLWASYVLHVQFGYLLHGKKN